MQVERSTFSPLVIAAAEEMRRELLKFYSQLAEQITGRRKSNCCVVATWI